MSQSSPASYTPGRFVWFEHRSPDIAKARAFYESLLGWNAEVVPMPGGAGYPIIHNAGAGIGGYVQGAPGQPSHWLSFVSVESVDATHARAVAAGARSLAAPFDYGAAGRASLLVDPTGAAFALWRGAQGDAPQPARTPSGGFLWNELSTTDPARALAFYAEVLGYTHEEMAMPDGTYHILKQGDQSRGGLTRSMQPGAPSAWLQYLHVDDCDAAMAKAQGLGATVCLAPVEVPNVGRFAILADPQGAMFAVMTPAPAM